VSSRTCGQWYLNIVGVIRWICRRTNFEIGLNLESKIAAAVSSDQLTLPRIWKYERKARDYRSLYCFVHNIDEKEKTFEKIETRQKEKKSSSSSLGP
jgi:hypothetical protein